LNAKKKDTNKPKGGGWEPIVRRGNEPGRKDGGRDRRKWTKNKRKVTQEKGGERGGGCWDFMEKEGGCLVQLLESNI